MKFLHFLTYQLLSLLSAVQAAPTLAPAVNADYDAVIVGGGPAGLSALSGLARVRRKVLLVDSGEYRNDPTRHAHDILGFDGVTPAWLRFAARQQISNYGTVSMINGTVTQLLPQNNNTYFNVSIALPTNKTVGFTARKIVLATGMRDVLPSTQGISENWGKGIYWCPWCDGNEHAGQSLGILASLRSAVTSVREILTLNQDIVLLVNGTDTPDNRAATTAAFPGWESYLQLLNVPIENRTIQAITRLRDGYDPFADPSLPTHPENDLFQVNFTTGESIMRNAFFADFPSVQKSDLGQQAGVQLYGGKLAANNTQGLQTNLAGVFAVGDANSDNVTNVPHAFFTGKRTAVFLHVQIERENSFAQIARVSRREPEQAEVQKLWERMNVPDDITYAQGSI